jgi:septal ring factor EnvC (AmiA/AmiB activator)
MNKIKLFFYRLFFPNIFELIKEQNLLIDNLQEKYKNLLTDIRNLEEENIETSNILYELMNQIEAVDNRIDIITQECRRIENV